ncbi:hypothetical protein F441_02702 [Phytophthora nicotianae CJ01A1]|uniref:RxLR effector protein n=2 Tax=Phytophthora nicotianae TaxID=4792 RepID=W2HGM4_PHYNI|nr:hypothetical protein L915_02626 [Phytophthora nicotianae]ETL47666.1 hypothetical protein L916_02603 [Phytophthora nicotianae]ETP24268.1 hypothetical protein F441_02702 [Phytophthora nicotianae CJ01A1]
MRSIFYVVVVFALFARSSVVAAFPHPNESGLLLKTSRESAANIKRFLRVASQEVVQSSGNGYGGIFKSAASSVNKVIPRPDSPNMKKLIEKANLARLIKNASNK